MTAFWKKLRRQRFTRKENTVKIVLVHVPQLLDQRALLAAQVILVLELIQSDQKEADLNLLTRPEPADPVNLEYPGLSPYQKDWRTNFP